MSINIGLSEQERQGVTEILNKVLADAYLLLIKTKKYHWDVVGPQFRTLHELWKEHYEALTISIDSVAERVRQLNGYPLGTAEGFLKNASLKEHPGDLPSAQEMVKRLVNDHEQIIRNLRGFVDQTSEEFHDEGTSDFLTGLMEAHEEMAWMLRSFLDGETFEPSGTRDQELATSNLA
ncbi:MULTISPECIES: Dps family protein [Cyanophyceae]|jgi:starvation-inducible DNA-binding protein|uniref:DNA starvation/stationary phase protection protein n=1 Tax=Leptolyngbya subtilissima DQ-A4 TaxID=2933933 RepID=A0ABV0K5T3_9CYAN|nr:Dps family protein [Nodosilinea sp. FACHB-141]MBD2114482.1 DNA starvation/stationary phase protection protein [Nodosilinea sp. FACHB-141]MBW4463009.1 DNA starvation/stationary phase protection protein [Nodosilinea sp. WJT8-NPBG4]